MFVYAPHASVFPNSDGESFESAQSLRRRRCNCLSGMVWEDGRHKTAEFNLRMQIDGGNSLPPRSLRVVEADLPMALVRSLLYERMQAVVPCLRLYELRSPDAFWEAFRPPRPS